MQAALRTPASGKCMVFLIDRDLRFSYIQLTLKQVPIKIQYTSGKRVYCIHLYIPHNKLPKAVVPYPFEKRSKGYHRIPLVDHTTGSIHQAVGICELQPGGSVDYCLHADEEGIYIIEGELELLRDHRVFRLSTDDFALVPYGIPHALSLIHI